jgi:Pentapeptide repeats (8 copies)
MTHIRRILPVAAALAAASFLSVGVAQAAPPPLLMDLSLQGAHASLSTTTGGQLLVFTPVSEGAILMSAPRHRVAVVPAMQVALSLRALGLATPRVRAAVYARGRPVRVTVRSISVTGGRLRLRLAPSALTSGSLGRVTFVAKVTKAGQWAGRCPLIPFTSCRKMDLADAHFGRDLRYADLRGADLESAFLHSAILVGADLRRANLTGATLAAADLRGADLRKANLQGAVLIEARLRGARLAGARLCDTLMPNGRPRHTGCGRPS